MNPEPDNPYAPPQTFIGAEEAAVDLAEFADAGLGKRFLNLLVDRLAVFGLTFVAGLGIGLLANAGVRGPYDLFMEMGTIGDYALTYLLIIVYYVTMEGAFGLTLGKLITGSRVVDEMGKKPSWNTIVGRSFARIVPFEALSFFGDSGGWHDRWSETRVVDIRNRVARLSPGLRKIYERRN